MMTLDLISPVEIGHDDMTEVLSHDRRKGNNVDSFNFHLGNYFFEGLDGRGMRMANTDCFPFGKSDVD